MKETVESVFANITNGEHFLVCNVIINRVNRCFRFDSGSISLDLLQTF